MKKLWIIGCLFLLSACGNKYYVLSIGEQNIVVGKDNQEVINNDKIDYQTFINKKGKENLSEVSFLLKDLDEVIKIDDYELNKGVMESCIDLGGEYTDDLIPTCLIHKEVKGRENIIILRGNILSDEVDVIDNVTIKYDYQLGD